MCLSSLPAFCLHACLRFSLINAFFYPIVSANGVSLLRWLPLVSLQNARSEHIILEWIWQFISGYNFFYSVNSKTVGIKSTDFVFMYVCEVENIFFTSTYGCIFSISKFKCTGVNPIICIWKLLADKASRVRDSRNISSAEKIELPFTVLVDSHLDYREFIYLLEVTYLLIDICNLEIRPKKKNQMFDCQNRSLKFQNVMHISFIQETAS